MRDVLEMNKKRFVMIIPIFIIILSMVLNPIHVDASNIFFIAEACDQTPLGCVDKDTSVAWLLQKVLDYIKIIGPSIAVVLGSIDFVKAIIISDVDNMKKTEMKFIKRIIAAVALFFIPMLVGILLNVVGLSGSTTGGLS